MKTILIIVATLSLVSCGYVDRATASFTGNSVSCFKGYSVVQMTSGSFYEMTQTPNGPALVPCHKS